MTTHMTEIETGVYRQMLDDAAPYEDTDDPNKRAHIVNPPANTHIWREGMEAQDIVDIARVRGIEIVALCGYKFVPKHNPDKLDACTQCFKVAGDIMSGLGE